MPEEIKHEVECAEFEALLSDALDGKEQLSPARQQSFEAHRRVCAVCGPLFADAQAGRQWLRSLEAVEPPVDLVHNILAATSGIVSARPQAARDGSLARLGERARQWWDLFFTPLTAFVRQPRFVMSFGMIFFTCSLLLSVAGVQPKDVAQVSLRPAALRHAYSGAQIKVVKYYDNIRFVYEIESKLRELKRANAPAGPGPEYRKEEQKENRRNDTSGQPERRQERNYSREHRQMLLAKMTEGPNEVRGCELRAASCEQTQARSWPAARSSKPPLATVTTNRRFV